jgi:hypothetical protein
MPWLVGRRSFALLNCRKRFTLGRADHLLKLL